VGKTYVIHYIIVTGPDSDCIVSVFDNEDEFMVLQAEFQFRVSWLCICQKLGRLLVVALNCVWCAYSHAH